MSKAGPALVTSDRSVEFPKLDFAISAGDTQELPADKDAQTKILAHRSIRELKPKKEDTTS